MPTYAELKENPRQFLAITSLTVTEFDRLLPMFREVYESRYRPTRTQSGQARQRRVGGGRKFHLATIEDKLLFILMYQKTYPIQSVQGLAFGLSQPRANELIQEFTPLLNKALKCLGYAPERDPVAFPKSAAAPATPRPALQIDGTERRRQRPKNPKKQSQHYSGKKKHMSIRTFSSSTSFSAKWLISAKLIQVPSAIKRPPTSKPFNTRLDVK